MVGVILLAVAGVWAIFTGGAFLTLAQDKGMRKSWAILRLLVGIAIIALALRLAWGHGAF